MELITTSDYSRVEASRLSRHSSETSGHAVSRTSSSVSIAYLWKNVLTCSIAFCALCGCYSIYTPMIESLLSCLKFNRCHCKNHLHSMNLRSSRLKPRLRCSSQIERVHHSHRSLAICLALSHFDISSGTRLVNTYAIMTRYSGRVIM